MTRMSLRQRVVKSIKEDKYFSQDLLDVLFVDVFVVLLIFAYISVQHGDIADVGVMMVVVMVSALMIYKIFSILRGISSMYMKFFGTIAPIGMFAPLEQSVYVIIVQLIMLVPYVVIKVLYDMKEMKK